jgi:hypothetical protein
MTGIEKTIEQTKAELLPFESWERLTGESSAAYAAFLAYRDYGPDRNIRRAVSAFLQDAAAALAGKDGETGPEQGTVEKRYRMWRAWSTQFRWRERAADYDQYLERLKQTERRKTIEAQEEVYRAATGKMLQVVQKKLDSMEPGELTQGAVVEWLTTAIGTEREIAGIVVTKHERDKAGSNGQLEIQFTPDFEGL